MKKLITLLALFIGFAAFVPSVEAGRGHSHSRSSTHNCGSCGGTVHRYYVEIGHDRHGHPIFGWRSAGHRCAPASHYHGQRHSSGHGYRHGKSNNGNKHGHKHGRSGHSKHHRGH